MRNFITGLIAGLALGTVAPVAAATLVGSSGYLFGWTVTKDGTEICSVPYVWNTLREIDCG